MQPTRPLIPSHRNYKIIHHCYIILQLLQLFSWWAKHSRSLTVNAHIKKPCLCHWMLKILQYIYYYNILSSALLIGHCHIKNMHNMEALSSSVTAGRNVSKRSRFRSVKRILGVVICRILLLKDKLKCVQVCLKTTRSFLLMSEVQLMWGYNCLEIPSEFPL